MTTHIEDNGQHIAKLGERIDSLRLTANGSPVAEDLDQLQQLIYRKGFTTIIQLYFVTEALNAVERNLAEGQVLRGSLLEGCRAIVAEQAELSVSH